MVCWFSIHWWDLSYFVVAGVLQGWYYGVVLKVVASVS